jgi:hypothetical protein
LLQFVTKWKKKTSVKGKNDEYRPGGVQFSCDWQIYFLLKLRISPLIISTMFFAFTNSTLSIE